MAPGGTGFRGHVLGLRAENSEVSHHKPKLSLLFLSFIIFSLSGEVVNLWMASIAE